MITISAKFDDAKFMRDMTNIINYTSGFLEGAERGKKVMLQMIAEKTIEALKEYIDSSARVNPLALQHMYEWYQNASPAARLFDIQYKVLSTGLSINSTFKQSSSIQNGSKTPFYDKARIMESGMPVTIKPVNAQKLKFNVDGTDIFTSNPVKVNNPGGSSAQGAYEKTFNEFFTNYFSQAFLRSSGILGYLKNTSIYKANISAGKSQGKSKGISVGYRWITNRDKVN